MISSIIRMLPRWSSSGLSAAAVLLALAGCGGGDEGPTLSPQAQAQRDQTAAVTQVQQSVSARIAASLQPGSGTENFEAGMGDWQNWGNAQVVAGEGTSGSKAMQIGPGAGGAGLQIPSVVGGTTYRLSAQVRATDPVQGPTALGVNFYDASGNLIIATHAPSNVTSTSLAPFTYDVTAPAGSGFALVVVWKDGSTGLAYLDDVSFAPVSAPPPPTDTNLITNGGFESGMAPWIDWGNTHVVPGQANSGTWALSVGTDAGGAGYIVDGISAGSNYRLSVSAKVSDASETVYVGVNFLDASGSVVGNTQRFTTSTTYTPLGSEIVAPPGAVRAVVFVWKNAGKGLGYVDDFTFSTAPTPPPPPPPTPGNLVVNGTFDAGLSSWVNWGNTLVDPGAARAQVGPDAGGFAQNIAGIVPGKTYRLRATVNMSAAGDTGSLGIRFLDAAGNTLQDQLASLRSPSLLVVAPPNAASAMVYVWKNPGSGVTFVDDVWLFEPLVPQSSQAPTIQLSPIGPPFVHAYDSTRTGFYASLSAARLDVYNVVFAWLRIDQNSSGQVCYGGPDRFFADSYASHGQLCIPGTNVSSHATTQVIPLPDGRFAIAWELNSPDSKYQVFDAANPGNPVGGIQHGLPPHGDEVALTGGGYVGLVSSAPLMFQRRSTDGTPVGSATPVGDRNGFSAKIVALSGGGFAIAWVEFGASGDAPFVVSRMFSADGTPVGDPVAVSGVPPRPFADLKALAAMDDGGYIVAWSSASSEFGPATIDGTFVRRFRPDGTPGPAVGQLNQLFSDIAMLANSEPDKFVAMWPETLNGVTSITPRVFDASALR